jgi:hypothetical protein
MITHSHISNDEDAEYDLEAPIDNTLSCEDDDHEEYSEGNQNEEFLLQVLDYLPYVKDPWITFLEVVRCIVSVGLN